MTPDAIPATLDVLVPDVAIMAVLREHLWLGPGDAQPVTARFCRVCTHADPRYKDLVAVAWPCPTYSALACLPSVAPLAAAVERNHPHGLRREPHRA